jgi:hypothetical protein
MEKIHSIHSHHYHQDLEASTDFFSVAEGRRKTIPPHCFVIHLFPAPQAVALSIRERHAIVLSLDIGRSSRHRHGDDHQNDLKHHAIIVPFSILPCLVLGSSAKICVGRDAASGPLQFGTQRATAAATTFSGLGRRRISTTTTATPAVVSDLSLCRRRCGGGGHRWTLLSLSKLCSHDKSTKMDCQYSGI